MNFVRLKAIDLKCHPEIKEQDIQDYIAKSPSILGLGNLTMLDKERRQSSGGRIDLVLEDCQSDENGDRYEVEIQLGATDPEHIIRTIEYWDIERRRYPEHEHCAVIIAEEITSRFFNVISLFNQNIPLIALKMTAYQTADGVALTFVKVLDYKRDADIEEDSYEIKDRDYWEKNHDHKLLKRVDAIYADVKNLGVDCELRYTKKYISLTAPGKSKNLIRFSLGKKAVSLSVSCREDDGYVKKFETLPLDTSYKPKYGEYVIKLIQTDDYHKHAQDICEFIKDVLS